MAFIDVHENGIIYENPLPQLRSRNAYFPGIQQLPDGSIIAAYTIGEAFESVDQTTYVAKSLIWERHGSTLDPFMTSQ